MSKSFPVRISLAALFLVSISLITSSASRADGIAGPDWFGGAYFVTGQPGAYGGELEITPMFQPFADHELLIGPKVSGLLAWGDNGVTRADLNLGVAETLWVVNAVGGGVDLDVVAPSTITGASTAVHFRFTPNVAIRLLHQGESGAWSVRLGVPYDTAYKWGIQAGITLQLNGIPEAGNGS